jgi:hypothetical protein
MQVVLELSLAYPFAAPSALRIFYNPQYPAGTFPQRPSEVYTPAHGVCMTFGTHLQVSQRNIVRTPWTLIPSRCKPETIFSTKSHESGVVAFRQTRWLYLPCPWPCRRVSGCADCTKAASSRCCPSIWMLATPRHRYLTMCGRSMLLQHRKNDALSCAFPYDPRCNP